MLWQHCMRSQITPQSLKRMKRHHLEYIAAHSGDVTYVVEEHIHGDETKPGQRQIVSGRNLKLQESAFRAKYELERRDRQKAALFTSLIAALIGAVVGGLLALGVWP